MAAVVAGDVHRFTVAEYQRMAEAGVLSATSRTELEDGVIIDMSPTGREHARASSIS
jgi:Uma2 family endonuclease